MDYRIDKRVGHYLSASKRRNPHRNQLGLSTGARFGGADHTRMGVVDVRNDVERHVGEPLPPTLLGVTRALPVAKYRAKGGWRLAKRFQPHIAKEGPLIRGQYPQVHQLRPMITCVGRARYVAWIERATVERAFAMRAIRVARYGGPEVLTLEEIAKPEIAENQVLVRVKAAGVGPWDALVRTGTSGLPQALPLTPGSDIAGTVDRIGAKVTDFAPRPKPR
jgi:hypothetical protein